MFKIHKTVYGDIVIFVNGEMEWTVPEDPANTDYQNYLAWIEEGNSPEL